MLVLIGIGLAAGFITAISPCVLPVLPIIFAGGATGSRRKPFAIIAGLIVSFTAFTLFGVWLLKQLGLPEDFLRNLAIALLFLVAATLLFPKVEEIVQTPFLRLTRRPGGELGGGFLLGASLGLVFVPCAGPVLAAITVVGATQDVGARAIVLTLAYATGAAIPMLIVAFGGRAGMTALRPHAHRIRQVLGVVVALTALAIALNVDRHFQTALPGYTESLQKKVEQNGRAQSELQKLRGSTRVSSDTTLRDLGAAPELAGLSNWINSKPLTLRQLRGKVVLVDFWTYSCINCLRTLPHVKAWYRTYEKDGLVVLGVHTPEFAFEHVPSNVRGAVRRLGITYPVALDNDYKTWNAFQNQYWPAKYLIDRRGHLRYVHFGEGEYDTTEARIRTLLGENAGMLPVAQRALRPDSEGAHDARVVPRLQPPRAVLGQDDHARPPRDVPLPGPRAAAERALLRGPVARERRGHRGRPRSASAAQVHRPQRASRARRTRLGARVGRRPARADRPRERKPSLHAARHAPAAERAARAPLHPGRPGLRLHVRLGSARAAR